MTQSVERHAPPAISLLQKT